MARQLDYTDIYGVKYPQSFWSLDKINISTSQKRATLTMNGYQDAKNNGKRIIGTVLYVINDKIFDQFFSPDLPQIDLYKQCDLVIDTVPINGVLFFSKGTVIPAVVNQQIK